FIQPASQHPAKTPPDPAAARHTGRLTLAHRRIAHGGDLHVPPEPRPDSALLRWHQPPPFSPTRRRRHGGGRIAPTAARQGSLGHVEGYVSHFAVAGRGP